MRFLGRMQFAAPPPLPPTAQRCGRRSGVWAKIVVFRAGPQTKRNIVFPPSSETSGDWRHGPVSEPPASDGANTGDTGD
ncbi:hypothetical protein TGRH88_033410 [Toxoplasma gondii]|uniref:Uncharacterized protein n=1 Tax=Toxoplasma gondii TaxID=5811 RepID=A0A7J6K7W1_TOXGO|nr:hypothetical protein TGRH88_033410 [Toxoplasma gondii]